MQNTAVITLMYLMFGQFLILTFGAFILWWVGDFSSRPFDDKSAKHRTEEGKLVTRRAAGKSSGGQTDGLPALAHDHSIQP